MTPAPRPLGKTAAPRPVTTPPRPAPVAPSPTPPAPKPAPDGDVVGRVTHWFPHVNAAIVLLSGELRVGDTVQFHGHTTDFRHRVSRLEIEHAPVQSARAGQTVGIQVTERVREHDEVFKLR
jgi:putative protease